MTVFRFGLLALASMIVGYHLGVRIEAHRGRTRLERLQETSGKGQSAFVDGLVQKESELQCEKEDLLQQIEHLENRLNDEGFNSEPRREDVAIDPEVSEEGQREALGGEIRELPQLSVADPGVWHAAIETFEGWSPPKKVEVNDFLERTLEYRDSLSGTEQSVLRAGSEMILGDVLSALEDRVGALPPAQRAQLERTLQDPGQQEVLVHLAEMSAAVLKRMRDQVEDRASSLEGESGRARCLLRTSSAWRGAARTPA